MNRSSFHAANNKTKNLDIKIFVSDNCGDENDEKERTKDIDSSMKLNAETTDNQNIDNFYYTRDY